jgi:hypothetical protein
LGFGRWFDTRSAAAASRRPELVDLFGLGIDGSVWNCWRTADQGGVDGSWAPVPQLVSPPKSARFGSAVAAVSRKLDLLDVFFFNTNQELANTWWSPVDTNWLGHVGSMTRGFKFAPASNILALVSPTDGERLDVFAADSANGLRWVQWRNSGAWQCVTVPTGGPIDPSLGVRGAWFGGQMHLIAGMRDGSLVHLSHPDGNFGTGWQLRGQLPSFRLLRPMGFAVAATESFLVVAAIVANQTLFWTGFDGA